MYILGEKYNVLNLTLSKKFVTFLVLFLYLALLARGEGEATKLSDKQKHAFNHLFLVT